MTEELVRPNRVRSFLVTLRDGKGNAAIPAELRRLASRIARRMNLLGGEAAADDLIAEMLARLLPVSMRCAELLALDDRALVGTLRFRLRQIACEAHPRWRLIRSLRAHLRGVRLGAPSHGELPSSVYEGGRLSAELLARAASCLSRTTGTGVDALASELAARYFPEDRKGAPAEALAGPMRSPVDELAFRRDVKLLGVRIPRALDEESLGVLLARYRGETLASIASERDVAVSTVHARLQVALRGLRQVVANADIANGEAVLLALDLLEGKEEHAAVQSRPHHTALHAVVESAPRLGGGRAAFLSA